VLYFLNILIGNSNGHLHVKPPINRVIFSMQCNLLSIGHQRSFLGKVSGFEASPESVFQSFHSKGCCGYFRKLLGPDKEESSRRIESKTPELKDRRRLATEGFGNMDLGFRRGDGFDNVHPGLRRGDESGGDGRFRIDGVGSRPYDGMNVFLRIQVGLGGVLGR
jgi:hypothetical protein